MKKHLLALTLLFSGLSNAAELKGIQVDDTLKYEDQAFVLNGLGLRLATFFNIKVYVAGLYLPVKSQKADEILSQSGTKVLDMHMMRDLSQSKLSGAIMDGFKKACVQDECKMFLKQAEEFAALQPEVKEGQRLRYIFSTADIKIFLDDTKLGEVKSTGFGTIMLKIWIGNNPPNKELKEGLLGASS